MRSRFELVAAARFVVLETYECDFDGQRQLEDVEKVVQFCVNMMLSVCWFFFCFIRFLIKLVCILIIYTIRYIAISN